MKVTVQHCTTTLFEAEKRLYTSPDELTQTIKMQLAAAAALWPELLQVKVIDERPKKPVSKAITEKQTSTQQGRKSSK